MAMIFIKRKCLNSKLKLIQINWELVEDKQNIWLSLNHVTLNIVESNSNRSQYVDLSGSYQNRALERNHS